MAYSNFGQGIGNRGSRIGGITGPASLRSGSTLTARGRSGGYGQHPPEDHRQRQRHHDHHDHLDGPPRSITAMRITSPRRPPAPGRHRHGSPPWGGSVISITSDQDTGDMGGMDTRMSWGRAWHGRHDVRLDVRRHGPGAMAGGRGQGAGRSPRCPAQHEALAKVDHLDHRQPDHPHGRHRGPL